MNLNKLAQDVYETAVIKGFWGVWFLRFLRRKQIPKKLALIHSEVSEALECYREGNNKDIGEELADIIIRTLELARALNIDIEYEVLMKIEYNKTRPYKHGKRC